MGKLVILTGKTASGKDTILKEMVKNNYRSLVSFTDRPKRKRESEGVEYFFESKNGFQKLIDNDRLIEYRSYKTCVGGKKDIWRYGLPKFEIDFKNENCIVILDFKGAKNVINYYGKENCVVYYIFAPLEIRKQRCMKRGDYDEKEFNRRKAKDDIDFSKEKQDELNVKTICNWNTKIEDIVKEIKNEL